MITWARKSDPAPKRFVLKAYNKTDHEMYHDEFNFLTDTFAAWENTNQRFHRVMLWVHMPIQTILWWRSYAMVMVQRQVNQEALDKDDG
jgi:hypothetical protein